MKLIFKTLGRPENISIPQWNNWKWQLRNMKNPFKYRDSKLFLSGVSPYYLRLIERYPVLSPIVRPTKKELFSSVQELKDPLGEEQHSPYPHLIHRYPDRVLLLVTDHCGVYCRYCTRKRFTGKNRALIPKTELEQIFSYIKRHKGIRELILSGGDPLSLSDSRLDYLMRKIRSIEHIEIIRVASRMPVACPMRLTDSLIQIFKKHQPVFLMTHFNHPLELTKEGTGSPYSGG